LVEFDRQNRARNLERARKIVDFFEFRGEVLVLAVLQNKIKPHEFVIDRQRLARAPIAVVHLPKRLIEGARTKMIKVGQAAIRERAGVGLWRTSAR
jgi:hypothetical protein